MRISSSRLHRLCLFTFLATLSVVPAYAQNLQYQGGAIVSNPQIVVVYWGPNVDSTVQSGLPGMYSTLMSSPWANILKQYGTLGVTPLTGPSSGQTINTLSYVQAVTITPSNPGAGTISAISTELAAQLTSGAIPAPTIDPQGFSQTIYAVYFPPGATFTDNGFPTPRVSCKDFDQTAFNLAFAGKLIPTILFSDISSPQCRNSAQFPTLVSQYAFDNALQLPQTITAPFIPVAGSATDFGWDAGNILKCYSSSSYFPFPTVQGLTVPLLWSNKQLGCVFTDSGPASPNDFSILPLLPAPVAVHLGGLPRCRSIQAW